MLEYLSKLDFCAPFEQENDGGWEDEDSTMLKLLFPLISQLPHLYLAKIRLNSIHRENSNNPHS